MRTGYLWSWTAVLAVGLASAQTPGTSPAPAGQSGGPPPASSSDAKAGADAKANGTASTADAQPLQGAWDSPPAGGKCGGLLCGRPWARNGDHAPTCGYQDTSRFWVQAEYLLWRANDFMEGDARSGFRVTAGTWLDESHCTGFEAVGFFMDMKRGSNTTTVQDISVTGLSDIPTPVRLIVDTSSGVNPNDLLTSLTNNTSYFRLWGAEANLRRTVWWIGGFTVDLLAGFRHLNLNETLTQTGDFTFQDFNAGEGTPFGTDPRTAHMTTLDSTQAHDQFYGGQVGASFCWHFYRITVEGWSKYGVGGTSEQMTTGGMTNVDAGFVESTSGTFAFRPATTLPGGLLSATPITNTSRTRLSAMAEWEASLGYQVTPNVRAFVGYDFLWWSNVALLSDRSGSVSINKDAWFQGLDFGVQAKW